MLEVRGVTKRYGSFVAIGDVSLRVEDGSVYGLVGYNGAGKTTLLKTIAGVYLPDEGEVLLDGCPAHVRRTSARTFIVADEPYFLPQATPDSMRDYYRGYYPDWSDGTYRNLLRLFDLDGRAKVGGFSKGMQRQVAILLGLSTGARTVLLDESFDGLDLSKRILLKRLLRRYAAVRSACVVLSSHNLRELEDVADRLGMIEGHRLIFDRTVEELYGDYPGRSLEEIFLEEGEVRDDDLDAVFIW